MRYTQRQLKSVRRKKSKLLSKIHLIDERVENYMRSCLSSAEARFSLGDYDGGAAELGKMNQTLASIH